MPTVFPHTIASLIFDLQGSNVVIPNGSLDPWHAMGFYGPYRPLDPSAVVLFINGTTHCDDQDDSELPQVKEAQNIIFANVKKWLGHEIVEGGVTGQNRNDIRIVVTTPISLSTSNTVEPKLRKPISKLAAIAFDDKHRDAYLVLPKPFAIHVLLACSKTEH